MRGAEMKMTLTLLTSLAAIFVATPSAFAKKNHEIKGFHFASCDETHCVEAWADKGYMSQLQFGFTTEGATRVLLTSVDKKIRKEIMGTDCTYHPRINVLTLEQPNGSSIISLSDFSVQQFSNSLSTHASLTESVK